VDAKNVPEFKKECDKFMEENDTKGLFNKKTQHLV